VAKEKISIALDKELLKWIDENVDTKIFASRSHAVERALMELKKILDEK